MPNNNNIKDAKNNINTSFNSFTTEFFFMKKKKLFWFNPIIYNTKHNVN